MPKLEQIKNVLVIGSGPTVVGQACEFDYAALQACQALRAHGCCVTLLESNPATRSSDIDITDRTYLEPVTAEVCRRIIEREQPDSLLPTAGGQTGLNLSYELARSGVLDEFGVSLLGVPAEAIELSEDREQFKGAMERIGLRVPDSGVARSVEQGMEIGLRIGFPLVIKPAFTLGGIGGATVYNRDELSEALVQAIHVSPVGQTLVERYLRGWREFECSALIDRNGTVLVAVVMEDLDPMGVHTGDSAVVAPAITLGPQRHAELIELCGRALGGLKLTGCAASIQFALDPDGEEALLIEVNTRSTRSSTLAIKATGLPIARISAELSLGFTLEELLGELPPKGSALLCPDAGHYAIKLPRFAANRFPGLSRLLDTSMKSVGEAVAVGDSFNEALQKAIRAIEINRAGLGCDGKDLRPEQLDDEALRSQLINPNDERLFYLRIALGRGMSVDQAAQLCGMRPEVIENIKAINDACDELAGRSLDTLDAQRLLELKAEGFSDLQLAYLLGATEEQVRQRRHELGVVPEFKRLAISPCYEGFASRYSTYARGSQPTEMDEGRDKVLVLGPGPNRIGQGIQYDHSTAHALAALAGLNLRGLIVNSNPEAVSTAPIGAHTLYLEPLSLEHVIEVVRAEQPLGVLAQFGGQSALELAAALDQAGVRLLGTPAEAFALTRDHKRLCDLLTELGLNRPDNGTAHDLESAKALALSIGYPVVVRPYYALGGRAMQIVYNESQLTHFIGYASRGEGIGQILVDRFLDYAVEVDVDAICDGVDVFIGGIVEHIEEAGVHSGDSACVLPPRTLSLAMTEELCRQTRELALKLGVIGLINVQFAIKGETIYVLGVTPRASQAVPFVTKATGAPLAQLAVKVIMGASLRELGCLETPQVKHVAVREAIFPFVRFPGVDPRLGPEMKSVGEVIGIDSAYGMAFIKSQQAAGQMLPTSGRAFFSLKDQDKGALVSMAKRLVQMGFEIIATEGTADVFQRHEIPVTTVLKFSQGRPNCVDLLMSGGIDLIINTPSQRQAQGDEGQIRTKAYAYGVPLITTVSGAYAAVNGIEALRGKPQLEVRSLQEYLKG
ncbi:MAG: carbamoyl-phosphate synthase large subunit [Candidatus Alcyoniella australis]|nr:carbamoyl-phosphate synthase large subunit [Candidatus Alcyoniella australis]